MRAFPPRGAGEGVAATLSLAVSSAHADVNASGAEAGHETSTLGGGRVATLGCLGRGVLCESEVCENSHSLGDGEHNPMRLKRATPERPQTFSNGEKTDAEQEQADDSQACTGSLFSHELGHAAMQ
ncbi:hypothetical protein EYF80_044959 [Liparis tanakae]|uniref:Uncharacterized protein n=1 Tax=Liparis tanakae TaxID=230148 RepID=A0A4Z2FUZ9_9TELE|nr:hypothetical protein EYF80_044959 [Liparis tanakae]